MSAHPCLFIAEVAAVLALAYCAWLFRWFK